MRWESVGRGVPLPEALGAITFRPGATAGRTVSGRGAPDPHHPYRPIDCWYNVNPIPEQTAAMIQKRSIILVSDQAIISKW